MIVCSQVIVVVMLKACCSATDNRGSGAYRSSVDAVSNLRAGELLVDIHVLILGIRTELHRARISHGYGNRVDGSWQCLELSFV